MRAEVVRSGLVESVHELAVVAVGLDGRRWGSGEVDRPLHLRSAAKPFQAAVTGRLGGPVPSEWCAVACASHDGDPVHLALVRAMLADVGASESDLACPPAWPLGASAARRIGSAEEPRRIWHNCSGKHAAMVRACVTQGWDLATYVSPDHPLQQAILEEMIGAFGDGVAPVGVDGCGVPVHRSTVRRTAEAYLRLATDARYESVTTAMRRFPALVSGWGNVDAACATWLGGLAKRGAEGLLAVVLPGVGAIAVRCWDGAERAVAAGVASALTSLGWIPDGARRPLAELLHRPVLGGGREVGTVRVSSDLRPL
jgi:L-asparaginase II